MCRRKCRNGGDSTLIEVIGIFWLQVISPNAWCCPHITKCTMHQLYTSPTPLVEWVRCKVGAGGEGAPSPPAPHPCCCIQEHD